MSRKTRAFDAWIRRRFVHLNTELETIYARQPDRLSVDAVGTELKTELVAEGREHIAALLAEGNTGEGLADGFDLLGNVGLYMAACRRHGITDPERERRSPLVEASALALHAAASLGVAPRFIASHLATHNRAIDGVCKSFTSLNDEFVFLEHNTRAILLHRQAADALGRIPPLGISHPVAHDLLTAAARALEDVVASNDALFGKLDADRFFYSIRPYYKPVQVGLHVYRGANAGDFAGVSEIDLMLGLCSANDPSYSQQLVDKSHFMTLEDQARLRNCMRRGSLLDEILGQLDSSERQPWFRKNVRAFLDVCDKYAAAATQHHDRLVARFIDRPAAELPDADRKNLTASGPPLPVLLAGLEKLRDMRRAAPRQDIPSRHDDIRRLRTAVGHR